MRCWQPGTAEVTIFTNGHAQHTFLALAQKHRHSNTHTAPLIYTLSTKLLDYRFLRGPLQALMVQLISNANQKWRDCVLLTRVCSFQTIVALRQSRPGCPLSPGHCGAAVGAHNALLPTRGLTTNTITNNNTNSRGEKSKKKKTIGETGDTFASSANPAGTPSLNVSAGLCQWLCGNSLHSVVNTKGRHSRLTQHSPTSHRIQLHAK